MKKAYLQPDGTYTPYPTTRKLAVEDGNRFYLTPEKCPTCESSNLRFTKSDNCMMCQRFKIELVSIYADYVDGGDCPPIPASIPKKLINQDTLDEISHYAEHIKKGGVLQYEPCRHHGHVQVSITGTSCVDCRDSGTAREVAIERDQPLYVATSKCPKCKEITLRNTHDKSCTNCGYTPHSNTEVTDTPESVMMREAPDMVISKSEAVEMGLKVYRTGKACKNGHTGFRYVTTGNCIDCIKS